VKVNYKMDNKMDNKMDKKGILISEAVKIVLAVLGIALLIYLAFSLAGIFQAKNQIEQARSHLDIIEDTIEVLEAQEGGGSEEYILVNPKDWFLVVWPWTDEYYEVPARHEMNEVFSGGIVRSDFRSGTEEMPNECIRNNWEKCICFCKISSSRNVWEPLLDCNDFSICNKIDKEIYTEKLENVTGPVIVENLMRDKKPLVIEFENNVARVYPKK